MFFNYFKYIKLLVIFIVGLSSCASFSDGYLSAVPTAPIDITNANEVFEQFEIEKERLAIESAEIMDSIEFLQKQHKPLRANELNRLFLNLKANYVIDEKLHLFCKSYPNDSLTDQAEKLLIKSAAIYNRNFQHNKKIRRIINRGNIAYSIPPNFLKASQTYLWKVYKDESAGYPIQQNQRRNFNRENYDDTSYLTWYTFSGFVSQVIASTISMTHLEPQPEENISQLMPLLEPGDIICQKSRNRLTDKFIPGYFGHSAIYLGNSLFVEAILEGTVTSNPHKFAEGDSYLIIRHKNLAPVQLENILRLSQAQLGKKYDFQYDSESPDIITCAELVYIAYDFILWDMDYMAGRYMITPDNIANTAIKNPELIFISYFDKTSNINYPSDAFIQKLLTN